VGETELAVCGISLGLATHKPWFCVLWLVWVVMPFFRTVYFDFFSASLAFTSNPQVTTQLSMPHQIFSQ